MLGGGLEIDCSLSGFFPLFELPPSFALGSVMSNNEKKSQEDFIKLINAMYGYAQRYFDKKQELNKKVESRILACLTFSGIEIKIISDLFNQFPPNITEIYKNFLLGWKLLGIITVGIAAWKFIESLSVKTNQVVNSISIKEIIKHKDEYETETTFQYNMMDHWGDFTESLDKIISIKTQKLNNGIRYLFLGAMIYAIGTIIQYFFI